MPPSSTMGVAERASSHSAVRRVPPPMLIILAPSHRETRRSAPLNTALAPHFPPRRFQLSRSGAPLSVSATRCQASTPSLSTTTVRRGRLPPPPSREHRTVDRLPRLLHSTAVGAVSNWPEQPSTGPQRLYRRHLLGRFSSPYQSPAPCPSSSSLCLCSELVCTALSSTCVGHRHDIVPDLPPLEPV
jgi:hypothetical protein